MKRPKKIHELIYKNNSSVPLNLVCGSNIMLTLAQDPEKYNQINGHDYEVQNPPGKLPIKYALNISYNKTDILEEEYDQNKCIWDIHTNMDRSLDKELQ